MSHIPKPRDLKKKFVKTLILVGGDGNQGKTTLCAKLLKDNVGYISFDQMIWEDELGISEITHIKRLDHHRSMIPQVFNIVKNNYNIFVNYTIKKIHSIDSDIILIDSFYFTDPKFYNQFVIDMSNYFIVWGMRKF